MSWLVILCIGCSIASDPDKMTWEYVSPSVYENADCVQLAKTLVTLGYQIEDLHERLVQRRRRDKWQVSFVWFYGVSGLFIDGDGPEAEEFKHLRGEFESARAQAIRKDCELEAASPKEITEKARMRLEPPGPG